MDLLNNIQSQISITYFKKQGKAVLIERRKEIYTPHYYNLIDTSHQYAKGYTVQLTSKSKVKIITSKDQVYKVKLYKTQTTYFYKRYIIYRYSIAVIFKLRYPLTRFLPQELITERWYNQYYKQLVLLLLYKLKPNKPFYYLVPITYQPRNQPRKERIQTDIIHRQGRGLGLSKITEDLQIAVAITRQRQQRHCRIYSRTDHNSKRCQSGYA